MGAGVVRRSRVQSNPVSGNQHLGTSWQTSYEVAPVQLTEPDWIMLAASDPGASNGSDVLTFTTGKYGAGSRYELGYNTITAAAISPVVYAKYRTTGTNNCPNFVDRFGDPVSMAYEVTIRGGDVTSSGDQSARVEWGLSNSTRPELQPDHGDTICVGYSWYCDPSNWAYESNAGQSVVWAQWPKGADSDPYLTFANDDTDAMKLRSSITDTILWDSGLSWSTMRGHLCRAVVRMLLGNPGTVELWWALDDDDLVKQNLLNTDPNSDPTIWAGLTSHANGTTTTNGQTESSTSRRMRIGVYADERFGQTSPYNSTSVIHRMWTPGVEMLFGTDYLSVEPPKLVV